MKFNINSIKDFAKEKASSIKEKVDSIDLDEIKQKGSVLKDQISEITIDDIKNKGAEIKNKVSENLTAEELKKKSEQVKSSAENTIDNIKNSEALNIDKLLNEAVENYNIQYTFLSNNGVKLYTERERSVDLIDNVESLINSVANTPKSFDKDISKINMKRDAFRNVCDFAEQELNNAKQSAMGIGSGVAAGAAVASLAPSAALWVATTFGTASTGTAISALSGAAATNAALAWLGGGAMAAGGGGVAAGNALLALAGPIGWTIAGATILTSVALFTKKKIKSIKEKKEEIEKVNTNTEALKETTAKVENLLKETISLRTALSKQYSDCMSLFKADFVSLEKEEQLSLMTLVNNTLSIAATLDCNISEE